MATVNLSANKRDTEVKLSEIRAEKRVPAVVYGKNQEAFAVSIDASELLKTFRNVRQYKVIALDVEGEVKNVIIHDYQLEPVSGEFQHVDFSLVQDDVKLKAKIPVNLTGVSAAAKEGGMVDTKLMEISVKCLPSSLVESFDADLGLLAEAWDNVLVKNVVIDTEKFTVLNHQNAVVAQAIKVRGG